MIWWPSSATSCGCAACMSVCLSVWLVRAECIDTQKTAWQTKPSDAKWNDLFWLPAASAVEQIIPAPSNWVIQRWRNGLTLKWAKGWQFIYYIYVYNKYKRYMHLQHIRDIHNALMLLSLSLLRRLSVRSRAYAWHQSDPLLLNNVIVIIITIHVIWRNSCVCTRRLPFI